VSKKEVIWREILFQAIENKRLEFTQMGDFPLRQTKKKNPRKIVKITTQTTCKKFSQILGHQPSPSLTNSFPRPLLA